MILTNKPKEKEEDHTSGEEYQTQTEWYHIFNEWDHNYYWNNITGDNEYDHNARWVVSEWTRNKIALLVEQYHENVWMKS